MPAYEMNKLVEEVGMLRKAMEQLSDKNKHLSLELSNMVKAQGNLYRFQEKVERQKTIYAQVAEVGHTFNQSLALNVILDAIERFVIDHLNYERCILLFPKGGADVMTVQLAGGYYGELKTKMQAQNPTLDRTTFASFFAGEKKLVLNEQHHNSSLAKFAKDFELDECFIFNLGVASDGRLSGLLIVGNVAEHYAHHLRVVDEEDVDAIFGIITGQILAAQNTINFLDEIQIESERVKGLLNNMRQAVFSIDASATIIEPVSKFAMQIFECEIVNKRVFETLYKDLAKNSEEFEAIQNVFSTVFGESEMQWDLIHDALPAKIVYSPTAGDQQKKQLKIAHAPIWNTAGDLDKIMFVIEDVTELERLESQIAEKQQGIRIIQEIAANENLVLTKNFFDRSAVFYRECEALIPRLGNGRDEFGELMRKLHTIKGNARMYGFSSLATVIHQGESRILQMKSNLSSGQRPSADEAMTILKSISDEGAQYGAIALKVFGLKTLPFSQSAVVAPLSQTAPTEAKFVEILEDNLKSLMTVFADVEKDATRIGEAKKVLNRILNIPIGSTLLRLEPMVKEVSGKLSKLVAFKVIDEGVKIDRSRLDLLQDAFTHLIRNCLDHGLELPADRVAKGKPETGTISMRCFEENEQAVILLTDDGGGIDPERIAELAVKKGILSLEDIKMMSSREKLEIIFMAGFSTKEQATELSGRGLGMDFVVTLMKRLGGTLALESNLGKGTTFTIRLNVDQVGSVS